MSRRELREKLTEALQPRVSDRVIGWFAPKLALSRVHARAQMAVASGYVGGQAGRRATKAWGELRGTDADTALLWDRETLVARSQDLARNSPIARGAINTNVTSIVGAGLRLNCAIDRDALGLTDEDAAAWERNTEREFRLWSESVECDALRTLTFAEMTALATRSALECGDMFAILPMFARAASAVPYRTRVQLIEAPRVSNPNWSAEKRTMAGGIEKNERGEPVAVHISKDHPYSLIVGAQRYEWDRVPWFGERTGRRNVVHLSRPVRIGQTRGEPYLAPVIEQLKQLTRYSEAELMAAVVAAMFTVFVKTETGLSDFDPFKTGGDATTGDESYELGNGAIVGLGLNESIETANPGRPNTAYEAFYQAISQEIGVALEIPFEILVKHFMASYSASMAAILEAWRHFLARRVWVGSSFCQPIYETWLHEAVAIGRVPAPGFLTGDPIIRKAYCGATWRGPARGQIREDVETKAAVARIDAGISSRQREIAQITGEDFDQVHRQTVKERAMRERDGLGGPSAVVGPGDDDNDPDEDDEK